MELGSASGRVPFSCNHSKFYIHWLHEAWNTELLQTIVVSMSHKISCFRHIVYMKKWNMVQGVSVCSVSCN